MPWSGLRVNGPADPMDMLRIGTAPRPRVSRGYSARGNGWGPRDESANHVCPCGGRVRVCLAVRRLSRGQVQDVPPLLGTTYQALERLSRLTGDLVESNR